MRTAPRAVPTESRLTTRAARALLLPAGLLAQTLLAAAPSAAEMRALGRQHGAGGEVTSRGGGAGLEEPAKGGTSVLHTTGADGGSFHLASDWVALDLDAFGAFGSSSAGGDAVFDDGTRSATTVFEYFVHASGVGFLDGDGLLLPPSAAGARRDGSAVVASYVLGPWRFDVRSELRDCEEPACAVLQQDWRVTNVTAEVRDLRLTAYLDGDLFFTGAWGNDHGVLRGDALYQFDQGSDPWAPSTFLGLTTAAPAALRSTREVGEFSEQRRRIARGGLLIPDALRRASGVSADADGDGVTDEGFDVSLAASEDFGDVAPGDSVTLEVRVRWGLGALADLPDAVGPTANAGGDRALECEGPDGTVVRLDASGSTPLARLDALRWFVDGRPVAEGTTADVVLGTGTHVVELLVVDDQGRRDADEAVITIVDSTPPTVRTGSPVRLWPPDHRLVPVVLPIDVHDACDDAPSVQVLAVTSDEPEDARRGGDGSTRADAQVRDGQLWLRRERLGGGDGRVYRALVLVEDAAGRRAPALVEFHVPHDADSDVVDSGVETTWSMR